MISQGLKQMKRDKRFYAGLLICAALALSGAKCAIRPPMIELCINGDAGCICSDPRLEPGDFPEGATPLPGGREYLRPYKQCLNYIGTSPSDYDLLEQWSVRKCRK